VAIKHTVSAVRAIASEFARRIFKPVALIVIIGAIVLTSLVIWLCTMSLWWLFLAVPVFIITLIAIVLLVIAAAVIRFVSPKQTKAQRVKVAVLVDKIQRVSDVTQTPKVLLLARAVRDVIAPTKEGLVQSLIADTSSLKPEFIDTVRSFSE